MAINNVMMMTHFIILAVPFTVADITLLLVSKFHMPGSKVIKLFSCSTMLSMKLKLLINIEIA